MSLVSRSNLQFHESAAWLIVDRVRKKRDMQTIAGFSVLEKRKCLEEGQRRMNSRFPVLCRAVTLGPRKDIVRETIRRMAIHYCYREIIVPERSVPRRRRNCSMIVDRPLSKEREATNPSLSRSWLTIMERWDARRPKTREEKNSGSFRNRRWKSSRGSPGSGQFFAGLACILSMQRMQSVVTEGVVCRAANGECSS